MLFLTDTERTALNATCHQNPVRQFCQSLVERAMRRAAAPGLANHLTTSDWWHCSTEYVTDAAMARAILCLGNKTTPALDAWLRDVTLSIARRPLADWIGPSFREHATPLPSGNLETAHLTWAIAIALDLAPEIFADGERAEIIDTLEKKSIPLCQRWLDNNDHLANWRCVLNAGVAVAAAVVNDTESLARAAAEFHRCVGIFQPDGSHGESLQYGNYAAYALMLAREALVRRTPSLDATLPLAPYALKTRWDAASHFYLKPLTGWGPYPRPRAANFNDSAALYRPSADLLLHIATRARSEHPAEAALARWLFDLHYLPCIDQPPHDLATFGFVNGFGFLTLPLLPSALEIAPLAPSDPAADIDLAAGFSCGDVLVRDAWPENGGRTILALHGAGDPLHGPGHLHGDLNSFILVHNQERLLSDPGHSCYRNLIHNLETATDTHNTCTFETTTNGGANEPATTRLLSQSRTLRRHFDRASGRSHSPVPRGGRRTLLARAGRLTAVASEAAALYGAPIAEFTRIWLLCGTHALFVIDRIRASRPVTTTWHWLLNNRDEALALEINRPNNLTARRGNAGMKLFHLAGGALQGPLYSYIHDAYRTHPAQLGEGKPGSGLLVRWTDRTATTERTAIHAIGLGDPATVHAWQLETAPGSTVIENKTPDMAESWHLDHAATDRLIITEQTTGETHAITLLQNASWRLE